MVTIINIEKALQIPNSIIIDARTPKEFAEDHIKNAINVPLLDNQERHEIGIIYKQLSREKAIEKGMEYFPSKIPKIFDVIKDHRDKNIIVYCARGGMRSGIIAALIESIGYSVYRIKDGYKGFRNHLLQRIQAYQFKPKLIVLYGLTCVGKTKILQKLPNSLDLENLAQHRSSVYGAIGLKPNSQKKFENLLLDRLDELQKEKYVFVEGESRRIGDCIIPEFLYKAMNNGTKVKIERDINLRVKEMAEEYFTSEKHLTQIKKISSNLSRTISKKRIAEVVELFETKKNSEAGLILLTDYFDPLYSHNLNKLQFEFVVNSDDVEKAVQELLKFSLDLDN